MVFSGINKKANIAWSAVKVIIMLFIIACTVGLVSGKVKAESISGTATVTADSLNVRSGPGKDNDAIGKVKKGDVVQATEIEGDWVKITFGDKEGYVASEYIELEIDEEEIDEVIDEDVSGENGLTQGEEVEGDEETTEDITDYKVIFILIGIIVVVMIIILITIKSIKDMDNDDEYDDDDDDYYDDDEDEYEEDEYEEDDDVEYDDDDDVDYEDEEDDDEEYEEILIRRPKKSTGKKTKSSDDYSINIDPRYFD